MAKIKVTSVYCRGDYDKECVRIEINEDFNLGDYQITKDSSSRAAPRLANEEEFFSFPSIMVNKGEQIYLWTKGGPSRAVYIGVTRVHHLYWGAKAPMWTWRDKTMMRLIPKA